MALSPTGFVQATQGLAHKWWVFAVVQIGTLMAFIDGGIVNIALPTILREFQVSVDTVKWVAVGYLFAITVTLLTAGRLADMFGRKRMTVAGFALFTLSSLLCGAAPSLELLVAARVLQGVGAAGILANSMAILAAVFPPEERTRALGYQSSVVAVGQMAGPALGGLLVGAFGWRSVFLINLPIGLVGVALGALVLREARLSDPHRARESFDLAGAILSGVGLAIAFAGLERLADDAGDVLAITLIAVGLGALSLFVGVERRVRFPLLNLSLFRARAFTFGSAAITCALIASAVNAFLMPFYLQIVLGYPPAVAGLMLVPTAIGIVVVGPLAGLLAHRFDARTVTPVALAIAALVMVRFSTFTAATPYVDVAVTLFALGASLGLFHPANTSSVMNAAAKEHLGTASGFVSTLRMLGQFVGMSMSAEVLGVYLIGLGGLEALNATVAPAVHQQILEAYLSGQALAFRLAAIVLIVGALLAAARGAQAAPAVVAADAQPARP